MMQGDSFASEPGWDHEVTHSVAHMSNHRLFRMAKTMNLIQLRQRGWRSGPSASIRNPQIRRPPLGDSLSSFLLRNTYFLLFLSHSHTYMKVKKFREE